MTYLILRGLLSPEGYWWRPYPPSLRGGMGNAALTVPPHQWWRVCQIPWVYSPLPKPLLPLKGTWLVSSLKAFNVHPLLNETPLRLRSNPDLLSVRKLLETLPRGSLLLEGQRRNESTNYQEAFPKDVYSERQDWTIRLRRGLPLGGLLLGNLPQRGLLGKARLNS